MQHITPLTTLLNPSAWVSYLEGFVDVWDHLEVRSEDVKASPRTGRDEESKLSQNRPVAYLASDITV